ncbi:sigma-70 family RNA polymerase sigma factor [Kordia algicida OT-1]|uniref:RNA polymerase, sigma-E factor heat shock and oxidative stress n=1 Tax=Kordia algicida OT-1 TaxID=391587 RepID=A9DUZ7_9FLAO|nr:sigma-70 family RNA polymerase sigma factor [Kordia algicida]EDP96354.1 RNA polymerase, sigma-E factor; heat shock and oxidative stress [Kordia algicida OT-1]
MEIELLIKKFKNKDAKAFESLYAMYNDSIFGVINNIVKNDDVAMEVTQDVFIKAWNKSESYTSKKGRFFTWLLNIARNAAIDKVRSKSFKNAQQNLDVDFFVHSIETNDSLDQKTNAIGIKKYVGKLAEKCKRIVQYIYFKGYTQKETAEALEIPLGTVKTRNRNCIKELRKALEV